MSFTFDELVEDEIEVTRDHIERGSAGSTTACPVALALADHFGAHRPGAVGVGITTAMIEEGSFNLPAEVSNWIEAFDNANEVAPFKFRLMQP